jgi:hypothetical protein
VGIMRIASECCVSSRQLRTCRRIRSAPLWARCGLTHRSKPHLYSASAGATTVLAAARSVGQPLLQCGDRAARSVQFVLRARPSRSTNVRFGELAKRLLRSVAFSRNVIRRLSTH